MNRTLRVSALIAVLAATAAMAQSSPYALTFSTFVGGSGIDQTRDVTVDAQGNLYAVGGTSSASFPTTAGAYDRTYGGNTDMFVMKFNPAGTLLWSTYVGGPNYERAYAVEVDAQGNVFVGGRGAPGAPVTSGVYQTTFKGDWHGGPYQSDQNAYLLKFSPTGSLLWASFFGVGQLHRDLALDANGDVYVTWSYPNNSANPHNATWMNSAWTATSYLKVPQGGEDGGVAKVKGDGTQVLWATYMGGTSDDSGAGSIRVDGTGVYYLTSTTSANAPTTSGADRTLGGPRDLYVSKLSLDGSRLLYGAFVGGSGTEWDGTHQLAVDSSGNAFAYVWTSSTDLPIVGGFQTAYRGGSNEAAVVKLSPTGVLLASTYLGGSGTDGACEGIMVDAAGDVYVTGDTDSTNFPVTAGAYQSTFGGGAADGFLVKLSSNLGQLRYGTYVGGAGEDRYRTTALGPGGVWVAGGITTSANWPLVNPTQGSPGGNWDAALSKFGPPPSTPGTLQFSAAGYSLNEGGGSATIRVTRAGGSSGPVSVGYATSNGSASAGTDYTARTGSLLWSDGDATDRTFTVPVLNDTAPESNETVNLTLSAPTGGATLGTRTTAVLTILDNDAVSAPPAPSGVAATAGDGRVTIVWRPAAGATSYTVYSGTSPGLTRSNGTPHPNVTGPFVLAGLPNGTAQFFVVTASNAGGESGESAEVSATPSSGGWPIADTDGDGHSDTAEAAAGSDPADPASTPGDADGDGLGDAWEQANFGGLGQDAAGDPDGDGANNLLEYAAGTDPGRADTDGDGIGDLQEIQGGTDPLNAPSSPAGGGGGGCGATGMEAVLLALLAFLRRVR